MCLKMNEIMNTLLLVGEKFMPQMHLKQPGFTYMVVVHLPKIKKELKSLCKLEIQILFMKMNLIKFVFNMVCLIAKQKF